MYYPVRCLIHPGWVHSHYRRRLFLRQALPRVRQRILGDSDGQCLVCVHSCGLVTHSCRFDWFVVVFIVRFVVGIVRFVVIVVICSHSWCLDRFIHSCELHFREIGIRVIVRIAVGNFGTGGRVVILFWVIVGVVVIVVGIKRASRSLPSLSVNFKPILAFARRARACTRSWTSAGIGSSVQ
jgi:hypothetical protein